MKFSKYRNKIIAAIGLLLVFTLAYIRQSLFLVINAIIDGQLVHNYSNYKPPMWIVNNFTAAQLIKIKWPLTLVFIALILGLTVLFLHLVFHNKKLNRIIVISFIAITALSFLFYCFGKLSGNWSTWYFWSHQLAMLCQSPLIYMFSLPTFWYMKKSKIIG